MGTSAALHPTDQVLNAYGLGKLDEKTAQSVDAHLAGCPDCRSRVAAISPDSFLGRLRDAEVQVPANSPAESVTAGLSMLDAGAAMPAPPAADTLPPGLVDHPDYEILSELGRGGMGVLYLARNKLMGRMEALKVVGGHLISKPAVLERFLREIRSAARLHHPNIVTAYSAIRLGESLVLAMEYVDGRDLLRIVKSRGPLPVAHACNYIHQAALGLQHAHEDGMVHRDIKPDNLMLARSGKRAIIKMLDFGLAKVTSEGQDQKDAALTREGQMLGTPLYIAPEQIRDAQSADIRADIYSLGCTLYYLLSGSPPFTGPNLWDIYQAHFSMEASPLNLSRPEVPVELAALVAKMMAKEPERRFQQPRDVSRALEPFFKAASAGSITARSAQAQAAPPAAKSQQPAVIPEPSQPKKDSPTEPKTTTEPGSLFEGLITIDEPDSLVDRPLDSPGGDSTPFGEHGPGWSTVMDRLVGISPPRWWAAAGILLLGLILTWAAVAIMIRTPNGTIVLDDLPEEAQVYVDGGRVTVSWAGSEDKAEIVIPPGKHGVHVRMKGFTTFVKDDVVIEAGKKRRLHVKLERSDSDRPDLPESSKENRTADSQALTAFDETPAPIPSGRWIVEGRELVQTDVSNGASTLIFGDDRWTDCDFTVDAMRVGGNGSFSLLVHNTGIDKTFAFMLSDENGDGQAVSREPEDSRVLKPFVLGLHNHTWYTARVHVRGGHFTCSMYDAGAGSEIFRFPVKDDRHPRGRVGLQTSGASFRFRNIKVWSPDGKTLWEGPPTVEGQKVPGNDGSTMPWQKATMTFGQKLPIPEPGRRSSYFCMSPDGRRISQGVVDVETPGSLSVRFIESFNSERVVRSPQINAWIYRACFSPDGKSLAVTGCFPYITIWDTVSGKQIRQLQMPGCGDYHSITYSPDGRLIASGAWRYAVDIWDAKTGELQKSLNDLTHLSYALEFSPDSNYLVSGSGTHPNEPGDTGEMRCWDLKSSDSFTFEGQRMRVNGVAFSPDGKYIASASVDGTAKVWDAKSRRCLTSFERHHVPVEWVQFSPDGGLVVSAARGNDLWVWDPKTGRELEMLTGLPEHPQFVQFSPDGRWIYAGSGSTLKAWETPTVPSSLTATVGSSVVGFVPLFNGKDKTGWKIPPSQPDNWRVENGVLIGRAGTRDSHLFTERGNYRDFHLKAEVRINNVGNSGVHFRIPFGGYWDRSYGAEIGHGSGFLSVQSKYAPRFFETRPRDWFSLEVIADGKRLVTKVDGRTVADFVDENSRFADGHISFELTNDHRTVVEFRKIEIRELNVAGPEKVSGTVGSLEHSLQPGTVWVGTKTTHRGVYAGLTVHYELHVRERTRERFRGHVFGNGPGRNKAEVVGTISGETITWSERPVFQRGVIKQISGQLNGNKIRVSFRSDFGKGLTNEGVGELTLR